MPTVRQFVVLEVVGGLYLSRLTEGSDGSEMTDRNRLQSSSLHQRGDQSRLYEYISRFDSLVVNMNIYHYILSPSTLS